MVLDLTQDRIEQMYKRTLEQVRTRPKLLALQNSFAREYNELQEALVEMLILRDVDQLEGHALRQLGAIVGEYYKGQTTEQYRLDIKTRIFTNSLHSRAEDILTLFEDHHMIDRKMKLFLRSVKAQTDDQALGAHTMLQRIKGAAHGIDYMYSHYGEPHFQLDQTYGSIYQKIELNTYIDHCAAIKAGDDIWFVPNKKVVSWIKLDTITNTVTEYPSSFTGTLGCACYSESNSTIYAFPDQSDYIVKFDTTTNTESQFLHNRPLGSGDRKFINATYDSLNGHIIVTPFNAEETWKLDTDGDSLQATAYATGFTWKFLNSILYNGNVYMIPFNDPQLLKVSTSTGAQTSYSHLQTGNLHYHDGIIYDGYLYLCPHYNSNFSYFNLTSNTFTHVPWTTRQTNDYFVGVHRRGESLFYIPGRHQYYIEQLVSSSRRGEIYNKYSHGQTASKVMAEKSFQESSSDRVIGFDSNEDQYTSFDPEYRRNYVSSIDFDVDNPANRVYRPAYMNGDTLYHAPHFKYFIARMNWSAL